MSALPSNPSDYGLAGLCMRAEDYLAHGPTRTRYELVNGVVMMSPIPRPLHSKAFQEVLLQLGRFADEGGAADVFCETDWLLHDLAVFRPDICVYATAPTGAIPERLTATPDLIVEILSPGTEAFDLITKKDEYERRAVKEYWVIDPADGRVRAWHRDGLRFIESTVQPPVLPSAAISGFSLDLSRLVKAVRRPGA